MKNSTEFWDNLSPENRLIVQESILSAALDSIVTVNSNDEIIEWNHAAEEMFGYTKKEVLGKDMTSLIVPPQMRQMHKAGLKKYLETGHGPILNRRIEVSAVKSDGTEFPVELAVAPINLNGEIFFTSRIRDISIRKNYEKNQNDLIFELDHRVKNLLAVVTSMIRYTEFNEKDDYVRTLTKRIETLSKVHNQVSSNNWSGASFCDILKEQIIPFARDQVYFNGPENIFLNPAAAQAFTIVLHELLTNAMKHGSLSNPKGQIFLIWLQEYDGLYFSWKEINGPIVIEPRRKSFGLKTIENYTKTVFNENKRALINWHSTGFECNFTIPKNMLTQR